MAKVGDKPQKMKSEENSTAYVAPVSEKAKLIEKMRRSGYKCEFNSAGIPIFRVSSEEEADAVREKIKGQFSFGYVILKTNV